MRSGQGVPRCVSLSLIILSVISLSDTASCCILLFSLYVVRCEICPADPGTISGGSKPYPPFMKYKFRMKLVIFSGLPLGKDGCRSSSGKIPVAEACQGGGWSAGGNVQGCYRGWKVMQSRSMADSAVRGQSA